jgi:hypothetical protein
MNQIYENLCIRSASTTIEGDFPDNPKQIQPARSACKRIRSTAVVIKSAGERVLIVKGFFPTQFAITPTILAPFGLRNRFQLPSAPQSDEQRRVFQCAIL